MISAAIAHDIERAFRKKENKKIEKSESGFLDDEHINYHQKEGGRIIYEFLLDEGASRNFAGKVRGLIERHEIGGDLEQNLLKDADSISFFENNSGRFIRDMVPVFGRKKVEERFNWMYSRITSEKAVKIAEPWYKEVSKKLER